MLLNNTNTPTMILNDRADMTKPVDTTDSSILRHHGIISGSQYAFILYLRKVLVVYHVPTTFKQCRLFPCHWLTVQQLHHQSDTYAHIQCAGCQSRTRAHP